MMTEPAIFEFMLAVEPAKHGLKMLGVLPRSQRRRSRDIDLCSRNFNLTLSIRLVPLGSVDIDRSIPG